MATILERNKNVKPKKKTHEEYAEDALYREVWEEVNNEKTQRFIKKYSKYLIAGALVLLIIATAIQIGVRTHHENKLATAANYETAVENTDARALAALAENASGATADLALFQSYLLDNDVKKLEKLAANGNTRDFRDLARVHIVNIQGDAMSAAEVEKYLSDMDTKKSPFYYTSRMIVAQKYLAAGDRANANKWLDVIINDADAPAVISANAQALK
mgnify:CR=1 FL=1